MKKIASLITFILVSLFVAEIFLFLDINEKPSTIAPIAIAAGLMAVFISKPLTHQYKMLFDEQYKRQFKGLKKHHRHGSKHKSDTTNNALI